MSYICQVVYKLIPCIYQIWYLYSYYKTIRICKNFAFQRVTQLKRMIAENVAEIIQIKVILTLVQLKIMIAE